MVRVRALAAFREKLRMLSEGRQAHIIGRARRLQTDPYDKGLRLRPLRCAPPGHFLIDSAYGDRIVVRQDAADLYTLVDCGGHSIIAEWEARVTRIEGSDNGS